MAFVWVDRERRYFVSTVSTFKDDKPYNRVRWRQPELSIEDGADIDPSDQNNTEAERQELTVPQPEACDIYYATCGVIDQHNRHRQDTQSLEKTYKQEVGINELPLRYLLCIVTVKCKFPIH